MADVSGTGETGQSIEREAERRVGRGLLSRFIGAVFLVLLCGLLLLDQALLRANENQARLDVQSGALLTESFVTAHDALLERAAALVATHSERRDSAYLHADITRMLNQTPSIRRVWATASDGRRILDLMSDSTSRTALSAALIDSMARMPLRNRVAISVVQRTRGTRDSTVRGALITIVRPLVAVESTTVAGDSSARDPMGTVGMVIDGADLHGLLERNKAKTRMTLVVLAGADTITMLGTGSDGQHSLSGDMSDATIRLPNGGTWSARASHALTTPAQRWGMWALGIGGIVFLAMGLLRERQRALHVAARSVELERLYSDVKRANQAKSEFLANVSHELRTPLNAIVGFVELLRDGFYGDLTPRQVPPVDRIAASATHLRHLVDQVLDIAKIAAGRLEVHTETIVLRPFVLNVASELESLVSEKGLALSITVGASLPRVRTDPTHLRQILINLIGNAVKYTSAGSVSVRARLLGAPEEIQQPYADAARRDG